jgi:hypothetical protein
VVLLSQSARHLALVVMCQSRLVLALRVVQSVFRAALDPFLMAVD